MRGGFDFLRVVIPRRDALSMIYFFKISLISSEDGSSFADLRRKVVKPIECLGFEDTLFESLLSAEGILVLGF